MVKYGVFSFSFFFSLFLFANEVTVSEPIIRLLPPSVKNTAAYLTLVNKSDKDIELVSGYSQVAARVELHDHVMKGDLMQMVKQDSIMLRAGESLKFQPSGLHVMLLGLKEPLKKSQEIEINLVAKDGYEIKVIGIVDDLNNASSYHQKHHE